MGIAKETLFRAIRRSEVLLWVGSGFSLYAGYPSGWGLVQIMHNRLTPSQQKQLNPNDPLPRYAEQYISLHDGRRNELTRELMRVFTASPKSLATHELLTSVAFIDQIVTTNYDNLFELTYGHRLHKVTQGKNIPFGEPSQVTLYKVHGDFQDPDSLIVSEKDFRGFFNKQDELLWISLKALMAKRHLVFVGYSLEDPNIKELFEWLLDTLGTQMREAFFIAPNQSELTQKWLAKNNLTYIDSTGETLVEELVAELKESVLTELKNGLISQEKTSQFLDRLGMNFGYESNSQGLDVIHLGKKVGDTQQVLSFTLRESTPSSEGLMKILNGETLDPVRLTATDDFKGIIRVEGLRMPNEIFEAIIIPKAAWDKTIDIFFADGTCFPEIRVKGYGNKLGIKIVAISRFNTVRITMQKNDLHKAKNSSKFNIVVGTKSERYASSEAVLENSEIMRCLGQGLSFKCMQGGKLVYDGAGFESEVRAVEDSESLKKIVDDIKQIEKEFSIVFRDFILTKEQWSDTIYLAKLLRQEGRTLRLDSPMTFKLDNSEEAKKWKETFAATSDIGAVATERTETWTYQLFGWKLEVQVSALHILNNSVVEFSNKNNNYAVTNKEKEVVYVVKEILNKRIVSFPASIVKLPKSSVDDFLDL